MDGASLSPAERWGRKRPNALAQAGTRTFLDSATPSSPQLVDEQVKARIQERHAPTDLVTRVYRLCEPNIVGSVHAESLRRVLAHNMGFTPVEATHIVSQAVECACAARLRPGGAR